MPIKIIKIDSTWKKAVLAIAGGACAFGAWHFSKWGLASSAASRAADVEVATYLSTLAPGDPQTHYSAAVIFERSFDPDDIQKALAEFEMATALSPHNYLLWLELGRARERSGDAEGGEGALRRALALAPNYARVRWALGNALLRQGRTDEAFEQIRIAVVADAALAGSAAATAWQFYKGDISAIRRTMDGSTAFDSALAGLLAREKRFDEAIEIWNEIPSAEKKTVHKETGAMLVGKLLETKKFQYAVRVAADINGGTENPEPEKITNGGFESAVKAEGAGAFEWQIGGGLQPQIVLTGGQKHGGSNSLYFIFSSNDAKDFRSVSQTIAVEPGVGYELQVFYRSELKTAAVFRWEIVDASDGQQLAVSDPISPKADWTAVRAGFKVPATSDGVFLRLLREGCGQVCAVDGNLWFDDMSLRRVAQ